MEQNKSQSGQLMVISVFVIALALLAATMISGLLTLFNLRQIGSYTDSMKAVFAADSGIEWQLYNCFNGAGADAVKPDFVFSKANVRAEFSNGTLRSLGWVGRSVRSFEVEGFDPIIPCP